MSEYLVLAFFLFLGAFIAASAIIVGKVLGIASKDTAGKYAPYECGVETFGNARIQFKVGYYIFALLFLVFDIEALFLFPALATLRGVVTGQLSLVTWVVLADLAVFALILISGLLYAWKKGSLKWE